MLPDRVSNPGPLTYESGALPIALRGPAGKIKCISIITKLHARLSVLDKNYRTYHDIFGVTKQNLLGLLIDDKLQ